MELRGGLHGDPWRPPWRSTEVRGDLHGAPWRSMEDFMEVRGGPWRSPWSCVEVHEGLHGGPWRFPWRSVEVSMEVVRGGLHGGPWGSPEVRGGSMDVFMEVRGSPWRSPWRSPRQVYLACPPTIGFLPGAVVYNASETRAELRLTRVQKLAQKFPHPAPVLLGACAAGKTPRVFFIGWKAYTCRASAEGQTDRQETLLVLQ